MKVLNYKKFDMQRLVIALAATLAVTGCGGDKAAETIVSLEPIAQAAAKKQDRVTPEQVADWIISKKRNYRLLDIRSKDEFDKGHIEGAENIPLASLILPETLQTLPKERRLVVYGNGSEQSAKASVMLRVAGFDAYLLLGGYNYWQERVLNPDIPTEAADGETPQQALQRAISCYFTDPGERTVSELPTPVQPVKPFTPTLAPAAAGERPKDEGC
ncbi:MAG: rhodanese-like domain-containing protein [Chromatiales bacterium]